MKFKKLRIAWSVGWGIVCVLAVTSTARSAEPVPLNVNVNGIERHANIYEPTSPPKADGSPLVFVFHGHGGTMQSIARHMPVYRYWPEAIVVYMQGIPTPTLVDPQGKHAGWQRAPSEVGDRDLKFFDTALASIREKYHIDNNRIYATGFSNGSLFTFLLWGQRPNVFAAFAACSGPPWTGVKLTVPKPVFIVAGRTDRIFSFDKYKATIQQVRTIRQRHRPGQTGCGWHNALSLRQKHPRRNPRPPRRPRPAAPRHPTHRRILPVAKTQRLIGLLRGGGCPIILILQHP